MRLRKTELLIKTGFFFLFSMVLASIYLHYTPLALLLSLVLFIFAYMYIDKLLKERIKLWQELHKHTYTDTNTGLPNRLQLLQDKQKIDPNHLATLILINIDSFQNTNNFYGHTFGDRFLKIIGQWLNANLPPRKRLFV